MQQGDVLSVAKYVNNDKRMVYVYIIYGWKPFHHHGVSFICPSQII